MTPDIPPEAENRLRSLLGDLAAGRWEQARSEFDEGLRGRVDADTIARRWTATIPAGGFKGTGALSARQSGDYSVVQVPLTFQTGNATAHVILDQAGQVAGLELKYPRRQWLGLRRSVHFFAIGNGDPEVSKTLHALL
jgi:hypothetical protein